jgi:hypothetical protein
MCNRRRVGPRCAGGIPVRTGQAIVRLPEGAEYEGTVLYDGHAVTLDGHRRYIEGVGDHRTVRLGNAVERTWPVERVDVVEWQA